MKAKVLIVLAGMLIVCVAGTAEDPMKKRAQTLMSELDVELPTNGNFKELGLAQEALSQQKFNSMGGFSVRQRNMAADDGGIIRKKILLVNDKGQNKVVVELKRAKSTRAAQRDLFRELAMSSAPLGVLLKGYQVKKDGPGDTCVMSTIVDKRSGKDVIDKVYFRRGNIVVSVKAVLRSAKPEEIAKQLKGIKLMELASEMNERLVGGEEKRSSKNVEKYLDLPYRIQIEQIARKLKSAQGVGSFLIIKDKKLHLEPGGRVLRPVTFKLCSDKMNVFSVTVYDYRSWNRVCDKIYRQITISAEPQNVSECYATDKAEDFYAVTIKGGKPEIWHFDLRKMLILHIDPQFSENEADENEEYKIRRINEVVEEVMAFMEGKAGSSAEQKAKYQEIKQQYQKTAE